MTTSSHRLTRRSLLIGAAAGAGAVALPACAADEYDGSGLYARRVHRVPLDPDDVMWRAAPTTTVDLGPQDVALPQQLDPVISAVRVRTLHDGSTVGFHLEWDDADPDESAVRVDDYRDACAVLLAGGAADPDVRTMGTATKPATLLHWKADWQRQVDGGGSGLDEAFPNRSVDVYPIVHDTPPAEVDVTTYQRAGVTEFVPGVHVGNPMSVPERSSPVEKAVAYGFSSTTTAPTQDAIGRGVRTDRGWKVVLTKPMGAADDGELIVEPGAVATCAFAVWAGQAHQAGSRKAPSITVHALYVEV
jgi:DMSO reductase family type II enzyme heme b subunit